MSLFRPDNFSTSEINFKTANFRGDLNKILDLYFNNYTIITTSQLDRLEINSENYQVRLRLGDEEKIFLLRKHLNSDDSERINFYLDLLIELNQAGVPVSRVVPASVGENSVALSEGIFNVFEFIDGKYFFPREEEYVSAAKAVARMHLEFNSLDSRYFDKIDLLSKQTKTYYNEIKKYSADDFEEIARFIENKKVKTAVDLEVLKNNRHFVDTVAEINDYGDKMQSLPKQIIHSDLHPHNLLVKDGKVRAILDFDAVRISEQARDAAFAIYRLGRQFFVDKTLREAREEAPKLRDLFIKEYRRIKELNEEEIEWMPVLIKDEFLRKLLFVLKSTYLENNHTWSKDLPKFIVAFEEIDYFWPNS